MQPGADRHPRPVSLPYCSDNTIIEIAPNNMRRYDLIWGVGVGGEIGGVCGCGCVWVCVRACVRVCGGCVRACGRAGGVYVCVGLVQSGPHHHLIEN